mmetsp:Transcript_20275/g.58615  ORF Transcript_20275/g.58615 Transcript_20275/m.58615 type:complete len:127 (-) Transcript_20275:448-828(-)|eukprot:CAMPEP_0113563920 /NCGR_PEP_ID=MMETSP0015_2-20120614/21328_1 /TAXON_ID=2838 /ORGANISM="Odontella" /LENGTH=126 /DNA_ID=CAMNT_0000465937 /DNA_START=133 /DNA_END=513 /DNA_ORIENTATION=- /assembly_acc=CAM_ASM_000160
MSLLAALGRKVIAQQHFPLLHQQLRFATKKAGGSSKNGRDSAGRRLGVKVWGGQEAKPGSIIIRQRGKRFYAGENVGMGVDHTLYSKVLGVVTFSNHPWKKKKRATKRFKKMVNVVPYDAAESISM